MSVVIFAEAGDASTQSLRQPGRNAGHRHHPAALQRQFGVWLATEHDGS